MEYPGESVVIMVVRILKLQHGWSNTVAQISHYFCGADPQETPELNNCGLILVCNLCGVGKHSSFDWKIPTCWTQVMLTTSGSCIFCFLIDWTSTASSFRMIGITIQSQSENMINHCWYVRCWYCACDLKLICPKGYVVSLSNSAWWICWLSWATSTWFRWCGDYD